MAYITPKTTEWVYEKPTKIKALVEVDKNTTETKTLKLYDSEFNWRGELFLTMGQCGRLCLLNVVFLLLVMLSAGLSCFPPYVIVIIVDVSVFLISIIVTVIFFTIIITIIVIISEMKTVSLIPLGHTGAISTCLLVVLGISSLPSVTATLSWREFTFIQSKLGWVALVAACAHDIFLAWNYMFLYWGCFNTLPIGPQVRLLPLACT